MKAEFQVVKTLQLTLEKDEIEWLKGLVQNPLGPDESETDRELRHRFWVALTSSPPRETP